MISSLVIVSVGEVRDFQKRNRCHVIKREDSESSELAEWSLVYKNFKVKIVTVYRASYSKEHYVLLTTFIDQFTTYLEDMIPSCKELLIEVDFSINMARYGSPEAVAFKDALDSFGLVQHMRCQIDRVWIDLTLTMKCQIMEVCKKANTTLHVIRRIRKYLTITTC